jgi:hypothetical protein
MKCCQFLLLCVLATFGESANSMDSRSPPRYPSFGVNSAISATSSTQTGSSVRRRHARWRPQANLADLKAEVVKDTRAASTFVQEQGDKAATPSGWLITLAASGLVVLQLRRKHKLLPQRRIASQG